MVELVVTLGTFKSHLKLFQASLKINLVWHEITSDRTVWTALQRHSDMNNYNKNIVNIPNVWKIKFHTKCESLIRSMLLIYTAVFTLIGS